MIQVLDWLYENELRHYPLKESGSKKDVDNTFVLPTDVVIDASIHAPEVGIVSITTIDNSNPDYITFTLSTAQEFNVLKNSTYPYYVRSDNGSLLVFGKGVNNIPEGVFTYTNLAFEESVVHVFQFAWLGVSDLNFPDNEELVGTFNFLEGYQFELYSTSNNIRFAVGGLYGNQIGCTKFSDYPDDCDTIISSINGVGPDGKKEMFLKAGPGFVVWDDPPNHRIYVGFAFTSGNDVCGDIPPFPV